MMKKIKKFEKGIKRKYGRKGYNFYKSVKEETLTSKNAKSVVLSFVSGIKAEKAKVDEKKYKKLIGEFRNSLIETVETSQIFMSGCLVINGDIDREDRRFMEIDKASEKPANEIIKRIKAGGFDHEIETEDSMEIIRQIQYELFVESGLTPYEIEVFKKQWDIAMQDED